MNLLRILWEQCCQGIRSQIGPNIRVVHSVMNVREMCHALTGDHALQSKMISQKKKNVWFWRMFCIGCPRCRIRTQTWTRMQMHFWLWAATQISHSLFLWCLPVIKSTLTPTFPLLFLRVLICGFFYFKLIFFFCYCSGKEDVWKCDLPSVNKDNAGAVSRADGLTPERREAD